MAGAQKTERLSPADLRTADLRCRAPDGLAGFGEFGAKEIHAIYVHPRFARRKVGTLLFQRLIAELAFRGVSRISLDASLTSVPFYIALGCTAGEVVTHCLRSGVEIPCVQMIFDLGETPIRQPSSETRLQ